jgi:hypothetical protein
MLMKLCLTTELSREDQMFFKEYAPPTNVSAVIDAGEEGLTVDDFWERLVKPIMQAYGYLMLDFYLERDDPTDVWNKENS